MIRSVIVLADFDVVRNMGHRFHGKEAQLGMDDLFMGLAILLAVVALAWILSRFASRQDLHVRSNSPRALFRELCAAHQLERQDRGLLKRLARHHQLAHPAMLFLEAARFEPTALSARLASQASRLEKLRERLFVGAPAPAEEPADLGDSTVELGSPTNENSTAVAGDDSSLRDVDPVET